MLNKHGFTHWIFYFHLTLMKIGLLIEEDPWVSPQEVKYISMEDLELYRLNYEIIPLSRNYYRLCKKNLLKVTIGGVWEGRVYPIDLKFNWTRDQVWNEIVRIIPLLKDCQAWFRNHHGELLPRDGSLLWHIRPLREKAEVESIFYLDTKYPNQSFPEKLVKLTL